MNGFTKRGMTLGLAVLAAVAVGIAAASGCDSGLNRDAGVEQTAGAERRFGTPYQGVKIRGPRGWVDFVFYADPKDFLPVRTDKTVR